MRYASATNMVHTRQREREDHNMLLRAFEDIKGGEDALMEHTLMEAPAGFITPHLADNDADMHLHTKGGHCGDPFHHMMNVVFEDKELSRIFDSIWFKHLCREEEQNCKPRNHVAWRSEYRSEILLQRADLMKCEDIIEGAWLQEAYLQTLSTNHCACIRKLLSHLQSCIYMCNQRARIVESYEPLERTIRVPTCKLPLTMLAAPNEADDLQPRRSSRVLKRQRDELEE